MLQPVGSEPYHEHRGAARDAGHPEPTIAQRSPELRLARDRSGSAGPKGIVEPQREGDEEREIHGSPQSKTEERRLSRSSQRIAQVPF